jgi:hypothetical protein
MCKSKNLYSYLFLAVLSLFCLGSLLSSCGKTTTVLPQASNTVYQVVNLSPDLLPVDLYIDLVKKNTSSFSYPTPSGYFSLTSVDTPFQIRSASTIITTTNIFSIDSLLKNNLHYTLFISGFKATQTLAYLLTVDSAKVPISGRGKIRFINVSPNSPSLDVAANGTAAFSSQAYLKPSSYIEFPAGNYTFTVTPTGQPTTQLPTGLSSFTVQDGKIYTLYSHGVAGRTDSAGFGLNVISNN